MDGSVQMRSSFRWAKGNELIQDHPFGLLERNVQCMRCRNWGHSSADRVCPMFEMSGNVDEPGREFSVLSLDFRPQCT